MIAKDSESYPYLAVAQHYDVAYYRVLAIVHFLDRGFSVKQSASKPPWLNATVDAWLREQARRSRESKKAACVDQNASH